MKRAATLLLVAMVVGTFGGAEPQKKLSPSAALTRALAVLEGEALGARPTGSFPRTQSNFAATFEHPLDAAMVWMKLQRPVHRDPMVDAYARWQLSSVVKVPPAMDQRQFEALLERLPAMQENPRASEDVILLMRAWSEHGPIDPADRAKIEPYLDELVKKASLAEALNRPAILFRDWLMESMKDQRWRRAQLKIERMTSMLAAGWDVRALKQQLDEDLAAVARDSDVADAQLQRLTDQIARLAGRRRLILASAGFDGETLRVETAETAVYDFDVTRWLKALERK